MSAPKKFRPTLEQVTEASELMVGFCRECGSERDATEPDAENYDCPECRAHEVYGADWYVINGWVRS